MLIFFINFILTLNLEYSVGQVNYLLEEEMTYSIKEVSKIFNLSIYTLRYYDKQGLLPFVSKNQSGYREFTESDLNLIHTICCLKNTGMSLKQIRTYIDYCMEGPVSIEARKQLLLDHRAAVLKV